MAAITIRDIDDAIKEKLRVQAAVNGRSMEAEARAIIEDSVTRPPRPKNIAVALMELGDRFGSIEMPPRDSDHEGTRDPFEGWFEDDADAGA